MNEITLFKKEQIFGENKSKIIGIKKINITKVCPLLFIYTPSSITLDTSILYGLPIKLFIIIVLILIFLLKVIVV